MSNKKVIKLGIVLAMLILITLFVQYQNNALTVTSYTVNTSKTDNEELKLKIAHISDLHCKEFGDNNDVLISKVRSMEPDIIAVTGDYIDASTDDFKVVFELTEKLVEIAPLYYVTGNHERGIADSYYYEFEEGIRNAGAKILFNNNMSFNDEIEIVGLDDLSLSKEHGTLKAIMENIDSSKITVLLAHEPQEFEWYAECGVDVVLSGHAHGGQIRIPFIDIGLVAPEQGLFPRYTSGVYEKNSTSMIVSRGLGNSIIPVRVFNQPEVLEILVY